MPLPQRFFPFLCALLLLAAARPAAAAKPYEVAHGAPLSLGLKQVADGLSKPVFLTHAGDGTGRLFVVEQAGRIRILSEDGKHKLFLDIRPLVKSGGERGLLGLAFHPAYAENRRFYVYYTDQKGNIVLAAARTSRRNPDKGDTGSIKPLLTIPNPAANHNGGMIAFGPDHYLYIGTGDGGGAGDPFQNGPNTFAFLGKVLRIDVNTTTGGRKYGIPDSNPFVNRSTYRPEIWAYGLRNPWRFSFDRETGALYLADVGQDEWEEVNYEPPGAKGGENYGWSFMEGKHCFPPRQETPREIKKCRKGTLPVVEYGHKFGCSITGGYAYRGRAIRKLRGVYLFADYCSGTMWGLTPLSSGNFSMRRYLELDFNTSSFGEDEAGEVYLLDHKNGIVYQITKH